ncbi:MAG: glycine cleavage system protein GcvH [Armatimonadetes bacterium]|jgi:glycine cleavage system H protein|nr:glycine cleavage system protein GcvH [Armatimonadota bacterium]MDI9602472.1 glycine cleavage system protein GcvH [Acidobacteriota bacterium]NLN88590.1 glycine cleavage system protein GcvH [candidate division WS1 bacterium]
MAYPSELKYTEEHEWVKVDGDTVTVGITSYAAEELGDIVFVDMPGAGATVAKGDTFGTIESVKTVADLFAPVSGEIVAVNEALEDTPETVGEDPYGAGWIIKIKMSDPADLDALLSSEDYAAKL